MCCYRPSIGAVRGSPSHHVFLATAAPVVWCCTALPGWQPGEIALRSENSMQSKRLATSAVFSWWHRFTAQQIGALATPPLLIVTMIPTFQDLLLWLGWPGGYLAGFVV